MEILNKNQRKKTLLRIIAVAFLVLAMTVSAVFAFHRAYANQGQDEIIKLERELEETRANHSVEVNALKNQINRMKTTHAEEMANKVSDVKVQRLEEQVADLRKEKRELQDEARFYKAEFRKCKLQN